MTYLSEDPTFLGVGLLLVAGAFLVALKVTQQGKYLIHAGVAIALALVVVAIEWLWVTDNERIEQVVYDLRRAVLMSDAEGVLAHLAPNVQYLRGDTALTEEATRALIRFNLSNFRFEILRISDLRTSAMRQARRGTAEFRVFAKGAQNPTSGIVGIGSALTAWSLGFQETTPGVWRVNRISPVSIPRGILEFPSGLPKSDDSHLGFNDGIHIPRPRSRSFPSLRGGGLRARHPAEPSSEWSQRN